MTQVGSSFVNVAILVDTMDYQSEILVARRRFAMLVPGNAVSGHDHAPGAWRWLVEKDILDVVEPIRRPSCARVVPVEEAVIAVIALSIRGNHNQIEIVHQILGGRSRTERIRIGQCRA